MKTSGRVVFGLMLWVAGASVAWAQLTFIGRFGNIGSDETLFMTPSFSEPVGLTGFG